jgi:hypothetical protein
MTSKMPVSHSASPIASDGLSTHVVDAASASSPAPSVAPIEEPSGHLVIAPAVESSSAAAAPDTESMSLEAEADATSELPTLDPAALTHFAAIQGALTLEESMLARALAAELTPAELRAWLSELREMSVPDAVSKIRAVLNAEGSDSTPGDGS